jgi:hypothetical protein
MFVCPVSDKKWLWYCTGISKLLQAIRIYRCGLDNVDVLRASIPQTLRPTNRGHTHDSTGPCGRGVTTRWWDVRPWHVERWAECTTYGKVDRYIHRKHNRDYHIFGPCCVLITRTLLEPVLGILSRQLHPWRTIYCHAHHSPWTLP